MPKFVLEAIESASTDTFFNMNIGKICTPGNHTAVLAGKLFSNQDARKNFLNKFSLSMYDIFVNIIDINYSTSASRERQCSMLHVVARDECLRKTWIDFIADNEILIRTRDMLLQYVIDKVFEKCVIWRTKTIFKEDIVDIDVTLSTEEEKTLRYVAGFIPYSLTKQFSRRQNKLTSIVLPLIESWREPSDKSTSSTSFLDYTRSWTERRDRGGLFCVNDEFYIFICRIENVARSILKMNTKLGTFRLLPQYIPNVHGGNPGMLF